MKWFKVHNDIIHDPKMRALAFEDRWHFVALMCLMNDGTLDEPEGVRDELVEVSLGLHGVDLANLKNRLIRLRLIDANWVPLRWEQRQAGSNPAAALRQRKYRERLKKNKGDACVTSRVTQKVTVEEEEEEEYICANALFLDFWKYYPLKRDKKKSEAKFLKLSPEEQGLAVADVRIRAAKDPDWLKDNGKFVPYPTTYLNGSRWEDEWRPKSNGIGGHDYV